MGYEVFDKLCRERGIKPIEVSRETKIAQATLSSWKKGDYTPKHDKLQKIADYFGVTVDFLMSGNVEDGYYMDEETAKVAQQMFDTPGMRLLFDAAKGSKPEDLQMAADLLIRLKETNSDG